MTMRILLIACVCLAMLISPNQVQAQNGLSGLITQLPLNTKINSGKVKVKVLVILKTDTGDVRTNNLFVMSADMENLDLPSKVKAEKTLGPIDEDVVAIFTVKKDVKLLRLPALLAKYSIDAKSLRLPVYVDGKLVTHPGPVIVAESMVKSVSLTSAQIHITTNTGGKGTLGLN